MQSVIDLFAAGFTFLLFASVYRKRGTAAVRFWTAGWFCVLLHFAALALPVHSMTGRSVQTIAALGMLILCGICFVLSRAECHATARRSLRVASLLGIPWLAALVFASLPQPWFNATVSCALAGAAAMLLLSMKVLRPGKLQTVCLAFMVLGCLGWLAGAVHAYDMDAARYVVLTECFGLNAVLLSFGGPRFSAATLTTSAGAVAWTLVWPGASLLQHFTPTVVAGAEIGNLPAYLLAAGMILTLLEEEMRSAALANEEHRLLFAGNPHPMWTYDRETLEFLQVNDAAVAHYGFSREDFSAMTLLDVFSAEESTELSRELREAGSQQLTGPWLHHRRDGSTLQVDIASQPLVHGGRPAIFAMMHDITERQRLHAQLMRQAHHDVLTDLPNRVLFEQQLEDALEYAEESAGRIAVFCIDLDRFKQINDSFGHAAGDLCLKETTRRITRCLAGHGVLGRSGGDEFMLFLRDLKEAEEAEIFASRLLREMRTTVSFGTTDLEIAASVGFAVYPDDGEGIDQLWRDADAAMYQAKRAGGSQWVRVSAEISASTHEANEIEQSLRRGLKTGELEVHYQPQMTIDGRLHSMEALFRSKDPMLKLVSTGRMIAIAEESGLVVSLGNWVLEEVCRQTRAWIDAGLAPVQITVNVSALQLTRFDFSRHVARTLDRYRLPARTLEFEVTESAIMPDRSGDTPYQIATLARMGIRFALDDFGKGYSSLGRLHQLPVDALKIDGSFTKRIADFNGTYPTVKAIVALAHTFGMKVVAEGVENEEQLRTLRSLGCDRVQGFLFSRPLPLEEVTEFLQAMEDCAPREVVA